jgi:aspartate 1-decarboxylase
VEPLRTMLRAKIHRAVVTAANLDYEGSLTIPPELLELSGIAHYEAIQVWNVTRGTRFETYAIDGVPGSTDVCVNGAAAHLAGIGDLIIVAAFAHVPESLVDGFHPTIVFVDQNNRPVRVGHETPGPHRSGDGC